MERGEFREVFSLIASYCNVLYRDREPWEKEYWAEFGGGFDIGEFRYLIRQWMNQAQWRKIPTPRAVKRLNGYLFQQTQPGRAFKATQQPPVDLKDPKLTQGIALLRDWGVKLPEEVMRKLSKAKEF